MNCPNCGNEINENQKFCPRCGTSLVITDKTENIVENTKTFKSKNFIIMLITAIILISGISTFCIYKTTTTKSSYELETPTQVLSKIDELQTRYFSIIKRNDVLLQVRDDQDCEQDMKELNNLFAEVESNIAKDNPHLLKYHEIEQKYKNNPGENTIEINDFASAHYNAVDKLLNEVYQEVRKTIPKEDFKHLITSELRWLKDVEDYRKTFDKQGFGTIGTMVYLGYQIDMRNFRTLLLMLYL